MARALNLILPVVTLATMYSLTYAQSNSANKAEALASISAFAREICAPVDSNSSSKTVEFTGEADAKLNLLLKKIVDLGVKGAARYTDVNSKGVLQSDLAQAFRDRNQCTLHVLDTLIDRLLPKPAQDTETDQTASKMAGLWNDGQDKTTFHRVDIRGRNFHSTEFGRYGRAAGSTIDAVITGDIAEGTAYLEPNTKIGEAMIKERTAFGTVLLRLSQDGQKLVGTFTTKNGAMAIKVEWVRQ